jgi:hypothetical protein
MWANGIEGLGDQTGIETRNPAQLMQDSTPPTIAGVVSVQVPKLALLRVRGPRND